MAARLIQAPVARWGGDRAFFFQGPHCEFEQKKLHLRPVALWGGDRGIFLKYLKTGIYFCNFNFLKIKISKIYVYFEIFQKYPPVAHP